jgi:hypothetical protein
MSYALIMGQLEDLLRTLPVEELRHAVALAESLEGKVSFSRLPSGKSFESHTRKARLWLDFIDDLEALKTEDAATP